MQCQKDHTAPPLYPCSFSVIPTPSPLLPHGSHGPRSPPRRLHRRARGRRRRVRGHEREPPPPAASFRLSLPLPPATETGMGRGRRRRSRRELGGGGEPRPRDSRPGGGRASGASLAILGEARPGGLPARSAVFCGFFFPSGGFWEVFCWVRAWIGVGRRCLGADLRWPGRRSRGEPRFRRGL